MPRKFDMLKISFLLSLFMLTQTTFAAEVPYEQTGNFWFAQCSAQAAKLNSNCAFFVSGLTRGALGHAAITSSKDLFCIPDGVTNGQAVDVFYRYMEKHPESRHMDAALLAFLSLKEAFPCNN